MIDYHENNIGLPVMQYFFPALSVYQYCRYFWFKSSDNRSFLFLEPRHVDVLNLNVVIILLKTVLCISKLTG